jgi:adenylosuccinate lyase
LFDNDHAKVRELDRRVAAAFDFANIAPVTGQTYTRKIDSRVLDALAGLAQSASKLATDLRLLQHEGEILEPFEREQIGSSAMAYKRNPMRAERICSLARYLITLRENTAHTVATQWFERTLDDSANRRMVLPDGFLSADAILILLTNVCAGLEVRDPVVRRNVNRVMPFMATERWLMLGVQAGGDRQTLHEVIRQASHEVSEQVAQGGDNDLLDRLAADPAFAAVNRDALKAELDPDRYVGRSPQQVDDFLSEVLHPLIESMNQYRVPDDAEITV